MTRDDKLLMIAKTLYTCDYPNGGSIFPDWESLPTFDKDWYLRDAEKVLRVTEGTAEIILDEK